MLTGYYSRCTHIYSVYFLIYTGLIWVFWVFFEKVTYIRL